MYGRVILPMLIATATLTAAAPANACGGALPPARPASVVDSQARFVWPARGEVIFSLCDSRASGAIDIAAPVGTNVLAAESGRVVYAGNELKGYGNLIIVRHDGAWVSAYAFADEVKVKRGDFTVVGRQTHLAEPTRDARRIFRAAVYCLRRATLNGTTPPISCRHCPQRGQSTPRVAVRPDAQPPPFDNSKKRSRNPASGAQPPRSAV